LFATVLVHGVWSSSRGCGNGRAASLDKFVNPSNQLSSQSHLVSSCFLVQASLFSDATRNRIPRVRNLSKHTQFMYPSLWWKKVTNRDKPTARRSKAVVIPPPENTPEPSAPPLIREDSLLEDYGKPAVLSAQQLKLLLMYVFVSECPVCKNLLYEPVTLACGHTCCQRYVLAFPLNLSSPR
jgi:hypothetical protein